MTGFAVILIYLSIAVLGPFVRKDQTSKANDQHLELSIKQPGFSATFLKVSTPEHSDSWYQTWLFGKELSPKLIPIFDYTLYSDSLRVELYTGDDVNNGRILNYSLRELAKDNQLDYTQFADKALIEELIIRETYWLGTDRYGRDVLSRLMAGTWVSFTVGAISIFISLVIGITLGSIAGFFRGKVDDFIMWLINVIWSIPTLLLVIAIALALGKGFWQVFVAVGLTMWVEVARVVRGQVLSIREKEYIEAGKALGYFNGRVIFRHVIPNVIGPMIVISAANFASAILVEAGLSFLGLGAQPPQATWGKMISEHKGYVITGDAYLAILPGLAIFILVFAFVLLGNGLRDALDTKLEN
jgi:peptide/nickel transport system permease protein